MPRRAVRLGEGEVRPYRTGRLLGPAEALEHHAQVVVRVRVLGVDGLGGVQAPQGLAQLAHLDQDPGPQHVALDHVLVQRQREVHLAHRLLEVTGEEGLAGHLPLGGALHGVHPLLGRRGTLAGEVALASGAPAKSHQRRAAQGNNQGCTHGVGPF